MHGYPAISTQEFSEEKFVLWCWYSQCENNIAEISGTAISLSWDIRREGMDTVLSPVKQLMFSQAPSAGGSTTTKILFVEVNVQIGSTGMVCPCLPPGQWATGSPALSSSSLDLTPLYAGLISLFFISHGMSKRYNSGATWLHWAHLGFILSPPCTTKLSPNQNLWPLFPSGSHHVDDFEQCCFNHVPLCTSSCGSHPPKAHLLVFILGHQISRGMDSWTNSILPSAATKHMHWGINLKPKRNKRDDSALQN